MRSRYLVVSFLTIISALFLLSAAPLSAGNVSTASLQEIDQNYTLGIQNISAGAWREAVAHLSTVAKLDPNNFKARYYLAFAYEKLNDNKAANALLDRLTTEAPAAKFPDAFLLAGIVNLKLHNPQGALIDLKQAVNQRPNDANSVYYLGLAQQMSGDHPSAIQTFSQAAKIDGKLAPAALYFAAISHLKLQQEGEAVAKLEKLKHDAPDSAYVAQADELLGRIESGADESSWAVNTMVGAQYDSNVILEPNSINISNEDDFRFVGVLGARWRWQPLTLSYGFYQSVHLELSDYNIQNHRAQFELSHKTDYLDKPLSLGLRGYSALTLLSSNLNYFNLSNALEPYLLREWNSVYTFGLQLHVQYEDYRSLDDARDNVGYGLTFSHFLNLFNNNLFLGIKNNAQFEDAGPEYDLLRIANDAQLGFTLWTINCTLQGGFEKYLYSRSILSREDNRVTAAANLSRQLFDISGTGAVVLGLGYQRVMNDSNVASFTYDRDLFSANLSANF